MNIFRIYLYLPTIVQGNPRAPFLIASILWCWRGCYSFPWIAPLTLDLYLISKEAWSTIIFFNLWYDSTSDWNLVSQTIVKHSNHYAYIYIYIYIYIYMPKINCFLTSSCQSSDESSDEIWLHLHVIKRFVFFFSSK